MLSTSELDLLVKLLLAVLLGGLIGLEREHDRRPAGLRTNIMICVGATMFGVIAVNYFPHSDDVSRMWQNVLTGIGFLGAGAVFKDEGTVRGLTTAATVWAVAALGLAIAAGFYFFAIASEIVILVTLFGLRRLEHHMGMRQREARAITEAPEPPSRQ